MASGWLAAGHIQSLPEFRPDIHTPIVLLFCVGMGWLFTGLMFLCLLLLGWCEVLQDVMLRQLRV